jgi:outer membrane protein TolC
MNQIHTYLSAHRSPSIQTLLPRIAVAVLLSLGYLNTAFADVPLSLLDAVRLSLAKNPDIQIREKQVESNSGALQQASGEFDPALRLTAGRSIDNSPLNQQNRDIYASQGFPLSQLKTDVTTYGLALDQLLHNGIVLSPSIGITSATGTVNDLSKLSLQNSGNVNFSIRVPLLKNSGESAVAGEIAANKAWEASKQELRFSMAQSVLNTVVSYWGLLAAHKNLDIARESEASVRRMAEETRKLIAADELPAADLNMLKAHLLDKAASRIAAEQAMSDARQKLGLVMGLPYRQIMTLELADDFPSTVIESSALESQRIRMIELAMQRRPDFKAAQLRRDSARTLSGAVHADLRPQLDLTFHMGYSGLAEGAAPMRAFDQNRSAPNVGVSISYQWPIDNNSARGRYRQQAAVYDQSTIQVLSVERSIGIGVESSLSGLAHGALQLKQSEEAVDLYRVSVEHEKAKYRLGSSTMLNVLTISDSLLSARLNNIANRLNYLNALVQLNFQTGALIAESESGQSIGIDQLVGVPTH